MKKIYNQRINGVINILPQFQKGDRDGEELNCYSQ